MHATDWLPTLLSAIGNKDYEKSKNKLDGLNVWETLQKQQPSPRTEVLINIDPLVYKNSALRIGDWKLVNQSIEFFIAYLNNCFFSSLLHDNVIVRLKYTQSSQCNSCLWDGTSNLEIVGIIVFLKSLLVKRTNKFVRVIRITLYALVQSKSAKLYALVQ